MNKQVFFQFLLRLLLISLGGRTTKLTSKQPRMAEIRYGTRKNNVRACTLFFEVFFPYNFYIAYCLLIHLMISKAFTLTIFWQIWHTWHPKSYCRKNLGRKNIFGKNMLKIKKEVENMCQMCQTSESSLV